MTEIILLKYGEIVLKGLNRGAFEGALKQNIRHSLASVGQFSIRSVQSTAVIRAKDEESSIKKAFEALQKVFGIAALSRAAECEKSLEVIQATAAEYLKDEIEKAKTFKIASKRADKKFPLTSPQICEEVGSYILDNFPHISVDVHSPDLTITVEVREDKAFIRAPQITGAGGLPVGTSGKALLLLSGGIDSPVAGYMMAKRGLKLAAVYFETPPYTTQRALDKVERLGKLVEQYAGEIKLFTINLTEFCENIKQHCPEGLLTILLRREMMRQAEQIAKETGCGALITGESLAQVASQTLGGLQCTDNAVGLPVFRPLIGFDKAEIINIARNIGTYETSCEPYQDCCVIFTPKHPKTRPTIEEIEEAERKFAER